MTVRNRSWDMRYLKTAPQGNVLVGAYGNKNQNGSNSPHGSETQNPYTMTGVDALDGGLLCRYQPDYGHRFWNLLRPVWAGTPSLNANDEINLINKLKAKFDAKALDGGIGIAELPQAVNQLAGIVGRAAREAKALKRGIANIASGNRTNHDPNTYNMFGSPVGTKRRQIDQSKIGDLVLGGSFGLRPLMNDAFALAGYLAEADLRTRKVQARQKGSVQSVLVQPTVGIATGNGVARKQIVAFLQSEQTWASNLGLIDPATIIWELVPWSFAIDWFTPIGGFIEAQSFVMRAKGTFVTTSTVVYDGIVKPRMGAIPNTPGWVGIETTGPGVYHSTGLTRSISTSLPGVRFPGLKSSLLGGEPLQRLANAFSLLSKF